MASTNILVTFFIDNVINGIHSILGHIFIDNNVGQWHPQHPWLDIFIDNNVCINGIHSILWSHFHFWSMASTTSLVTFSLIAGSMASTTSLVTFSLITMSSMASTTSLDNNVGQLASTTSLVTFSLITMSVNGIHNILDRITMSSTTTSLVMASLITMSVNGIHNILGHIFIDNNVGQWHPQHQQSHLF
ncbi:unnamed protein product [Acanthosepion pharaonis]|uniref:Uncharacterized protein n=1 Tax=Acanthosepion pharaonis TaxID=158019 RepID=A0A812C500_ACAPH|nr:unnamed protein product [Sepia pharaonis]